jgi:protein SCO1
MKKFALVRWRAIGLALLLGGSLATAAAEDLFPRDSDFDYDPPAPGSYSLPVIKTAAAGVLLDSTGKAVNLRDLTRGRITVLSFIYTRCAAPRACPYATNMLGRLQLASAKDQTLARNLRLVSVSFDPEHDTPRHLAEYSKWVQETKSGCEWHFVTAESQAKLDVILHAYDQTVDKRFNPNDPQGPLYHTLRVFLIDRQARIRNIYSSGTLDPRLILADIKTLLLEGSHVSQQ